MDLRKFFPLCAFMFIILYNIALGQEAKEGFISSEKAIEILWGLPEVISLQEKNTCEKYQCSGRGFGAGVKEWPKKDFPFYVLDFTVTEDIKNPSGVYVAQEIFSKLFYIAAYTAEVVPEEVVKAKILAAKEAEFMRQRNEAMLKEEEKLLKNELDMTYARIIEKRYLSDYEYRKLIKEYSPLFLKALNAFTPEIRAQAAGYIGQLFVDFDSPKAAEEFKEAVPGLIKLLKDEDYSVRYEALNALSKIADKGNKNLIEVILPLLKDSDSLVRRSAIAALGKLGDSSLTPVFVDLLDDSTVHQEAVKTIRLIGDERALEPLVNLFNKKDYFYLEKNIVYALGQVGGKKSIPVLIGLLGKKYTYNTKFGKEFLPNTLYIGADAGQVLGIIGKDSIPYLLEALKSNDYLTRLYSVHSLSVINDPIILADLNNALLQENNATVRIYLQMTITEIEGRRFELPEANLQIEVKSSKQKYKRGEPIKLFIYLRNKGTTPIVINTLPLKLSNASFRIIGPNNTPVPYSAGEVYRWSFFPTKESLITLKPQETYKSGPFLVNEYYNFEASGEYIISGTYKNDFSAIEFAVYAWQGGIKSQPIVIQKK